PEFCAGRLDTLIKAYQAPETQPAGYAYSEPQDPYSFETVTGGTVALDHAACRACESKVCLETCVPGILSLENDVPVLNVTPEEAAKGRCIECLACEVECYFEGNKGGRVILPIEGFSEYLVEKK
ncbi:MAG: hypothetical protein GY801_49755, partial [bacterium]|nr:hypothetical protein [bacterium]